MANYFLGGSLDHLKVAIPTRYLDATEKFSHSEMNLLDVTTSKTSQCTEYHFVDQHTSNRFIFTDTPGINDTRGVQYDKMNIENIIDAARKLNGLSAVITVFNGSLSLVTSDMQNLLTDLNRCVTLDNCMNIAILSNTYEWTSSFNLSVINFGMNKVHPFYIQMSAFTKNLNMLDEHSRKELQYDWEVSMTEIQKTIELIENLAPHF